MRTFTQALDKNKYLKFEFLVVLCTVLSTKYIYNVISSFSSAEPFKICFLLIVYFLFFWLISQKKALFNKIVFLLVFLIPLGSFNIPVIRHYLPVQTVRIYSLVAVSMLFLCVPIQSKKHIFSKTARTILIFMFLFFIEAILSYWLSDDQIRNPFFSELHIWASLCGIITFIFISKVSLIPRARDTVVLSLFVIYLIDVLLSLLQQKFGTLASPFATMGIKELAPNITYGDLTRSPGLFYASLINGSFLGIMNIFFVCIYLFEIKINKLSGQFIIFSVLCGFIASFAALGRTAFYGQILSLSLILICQRKQIRDIFSRLFAPFLVLLIACVVSLLILKDGNFSFTMDRIFNIGSSISELSQTEEGRPALILSNLPIIGKNLFFGAGPSMGHIESGFFTVLLRYGFLGFILFFFPISFLLYRNILNGCIRAGSLEMAASWAIFFGLTQFTLIGTFLGIKLLMLLYLFMAVASGREKIGRA